MLRSLSMIRLVYPVWLLEGLVPIDTQYWLGHVFIVIVEGCGRGVRAG